MALRTHFNVEIDFFAVAERDFTRGGGYAAKGFTVPFTDYVLFPKEGDQVLTLEKGQTSKVRGGVRVGYSRKSKKLLSKIEDLNNKAETKGLSPRELSDRAQAKKDFASSKTADVKRALRSAGNIDLPDGFGLQYVEGTKTPALFNDTVRQGVDFFPDTQASDAVSNSGYRELSPEEYRKKHNAFGDSPSYVLSDGRLEPEEVKGRRLVTGAEAERASRDPLSPRSNEVTGRSAAINDDGSFAVDDTDDMRPSKTGVRSYTPENQRLIANGQYPRNPAGEEVVVTDPEVRDAIDRGRERQQAIAGKADSNKTRLNNKTNEILNRVTKTIGDQRPLNGKAKVKISEKAEAIKQDLVKKYDELWARTDISGSEKQVEAQKLLRRNAKKINNEIQIELNRASGDSKRTAQLKGLRNSLVDAVGDTTPGAKQRRNTTGAYFDNDKGKTVKSYTVSVAESGVQAGEPGKVKRYNVFATSADEADQLVRDRLGNRTRIIEGTKPRGSGRSVAGAVDLPVQGPSPASPTPGTSSSPDVPDSPTSTSTAPKGSSAAGSVAGKADDAAKYSKFAKFAGYAGKTGLGRVAGVAFGPLGTVASLGLMAYGTATSGGKRQVRQAQSNAEFLKNYRQTRLVQQQEEYKRKMLERRSAAALKHTRGNKRVALSPELQAVLGSKEKEILSQGVPQPQINREMEYFRDLIQ
tara:strand:- start:241 stop:2325 length:2085 start_codon:yes stop_codon:yes gene_type:complete